MNKNEKLRVAGAPEAERLLARRLSGDARARLAHAFRLSAAALGDEPDEWPAQVIARLEKDKDPGVKRVLEWITETREGCWLKPIRAPLIAPGGPIAKIIDVGVPYDHSRALVWSKDGKTVTSFSGSSFRMWDMGAEREVQRLDLPIEWGRAAISDPPHCAVVMASQRQLLLVNLKTAAADVIFTGYVIETVAISADGAWAVTTSMPPDWDYLTHDWNGPRTFRLFDLQGRCVVRTWQAHRAVITDLALSADGRFLATVSHDQSARLLDLRKGNTVGSWRSARRLDAVAITPSGQRIAYVSQGGVLTVRGQDGEIVGRFTHCGAEPGCLLMSRDGRRVVMGIGGDVSVVDLRRSKRFGPCSGTQPYLASLAIDAEGRHAIAGEMGRQLVLWDLTKIGRTGSTGSTGLWIFGIWASGDKALIREEGLSLWDLSTGKRTVLRPPGNYRVASAPAAGVWAVASWAPASGGRIRIGKWGRKQTTLLLHSNHLMTNIQISRNGKRLVASVHPLGCRVLNLGDRRTVWQQAKVGVGVRPYLSPSGRYLLLCALEGHLEIVDLDTQEVIQRSLPQPNIGTVLFTPEDDCVLVQQGESTALLNWRTNSLRTLFDGSPSSMSEDGRWMVTESNDRKLTLWLLPEGRRMATFTLDTQILETALSPDGRFLIAGDHNGRIHILRRQN